MVIKFAAMLGGALAVPLLVFSAPGAAPAAPAPAAVVTEAEFLKVLQADCLRCHAKKVKDMAAVRASGWVKPGDPEHSRLYTALVNSKRRGHMVPDKDRQTIYNFVAALPREEIKN